MRLHAKTYLLALVLMLPTLTLHAQLRQVDSSGQFGTSQQSRRNNSADSLGSDKEIPTGVHVWTINERFGDVTAAQPDTMPHMYMNTVFTTGLRGEYNTTGNLGSPRQNRIFVDRTQPEQFIFTQPYDYFITPLSQFHFTNTLSPITNLSYNKVGDRTNGEDHFSAKFAVNVNKRLGVGFKADYLYGRGYYSSQSTSLFNGTLFGSYLGERYQAHLILSTNKIKLTENGGITDDRYITTPESFDDNYTTSEIPTVLQQNWNRNSSEMVYLTHRYSLGFNRKVPMTEEEIKAKKFAMESKKENEAKKAKDEARRKAIENGEDWDEDSYKVPELLAGRPDSTAAAEDTSWLKNEYVPVTSFIHTVRFDNARRIYQSYYTPEGYYLNDYDADERYAADSLYDKTSHYRLRNTFAISLLEGFNKWVKAGLKGFITSDLRHFALPDTLGTASYNEHNISVGAQLSRTQGSLFHFNATGETWIVGKDAGQLRIDATADFNFRLFGDTLTLAASGFFHSDNPSFVYRHYHSRHAWWDNDDMSKTTHMRLAGLLSYKKTRTTLRVAFDETKNHTYLGMAYSIDSVSRLRTGMTVEPRQCGDAISLLTLQLTQDFTLGPLNWESVVTYQKSSKQSVLAVPDLNIYTNLYLRFKIAHELSCDFGADARYFTKYEAPEYSPLLGQYAVQENEATKVKVGGCPIVNVYANFHLKHTRFFVMMSNLTASMGAKNYFFTPHYPLNGRVLRFGVSWNFFN